mmetsp:Transcript_21860/g.36191  ORF Transcript_21860/g.36191 Transcript_21860/m.36191 type:complete len:706 (+) Transcript_21860:92-2209(+)
MESRSSASKQAQWHTEPCSIVDGGELRTINLPASIIELKDLFSIFNLETFEKSFTSDERARLKSLLPPLETPSQVHGTLQALFGGENFCFGNPVDRLWRNLRGGRCNPEVAKYHQRCLLIQRKHHLQRIRDYHNAFVRRIVFLRKKRLRQQSGRRPRRPATNSGALTSRLHLQAASSGSRPFPVDGDGGGGHSDLEAPGLGRAFSSASLQQDSNTLHPHGSESSESDFSDLDSPSVHSQGDVSSSTSQSRTQPRQFLSLNQRLSSQLQVPLTNRERRKDRLATDGSPLLETPSPVPSSSSATFKRRKGLMMMTSVALEGQPAALGSIPCALFIAIRSFMLKAPDYVASAADVEEAVMSNRLAADRILPEASASDFVNCALCFLSDPQAPLPQRERRPEESRSTPQHPAIPAPNDFPSLLTFHLEPSYWRWAGPTGNENDTDPASVLSHMEALFLQTFLIRQQGGLHAKSYKEKLNNINNNVLRPGTPESLKIFQSQERERYRWPQLPYTYSVKGQRSIVAPVTKGLMGNKARDHFMLKPARPPCITVLSLVRDAASRLPGGVGSRQDVCDLLRHSQYVIDDVSNEKINEVVSGALDRLHYEKDPCVRYDSDRKTWLYLHRNRSEDDFTDTVPSARNHPKPRKSRESKEALQYGNSKSYLYAPLQSAHSRKHSQGLGDEGETPHKRRKKAPKDKFLRLQEDRRSSC